MASYKEKYLVKYLVAGSASNSLTYVSISSYALWCNVPCLLRLVPGPCRLQCLARSQQCPWICDAAGAVRSFAGPFFPQTELSGSHLSEKQDDPLLTYLDPHVRVRRWTKSYFHSSWSLDILNSWFKCKCWIFWTHELIFCQRDVNEILIKDHIHFLECIILLSLQGPYVSSVIRY